MEAKIFKLFFFFFFFLPYMGMAAILFNDAEPFEQSNNYQYPFDRRPNVKSIENWSSRFREEYV